MCGVEIAGWANYCSPCGEELARPRWAAIDVLTRAFPDLSPSIPRRLGWQLMDPDAVRALSDEAFLAFPYFGPSLLARFRAVVPEPAPSCALCNWVGEGVHAPAVTEMGG